MRGIDGMGVLIAGLVIFLGVHSIGFAAPGLRDRAVSGWGEGVWKGLHGLISLVGLVLIVHGFGLTRRAPMVLYAPPGWMRDLTFLFMLPVFPLLIAAYLPGRIKTAAKHPMLAAVKFWAFSHLLANGTLADLLLFGGFLAWAVLDRSRGSAGHHRSCARLARRLERCRRRRAGTRAYAVFIGWAHVRCSACRRLDRPTYADVQAAARRLEGHAHRTPVMTSRTVDDSLGARVFFKCENFQRTGAFKFRGAFNALSRLDATARARGVIAFSSGNHAQAVALAARILGIEATIVMPRMHPRRRCRRRAATAPPWRLTTATAKTASRSRSAWPRSVAPPSFRRTTIPT